jgi:ABC-2 type transport system ATP-binding protein
MTVHRTNHPTVAATGLGKRYGDRWVLRDVDLAVPRGSVLGLLGPNGAGKTTTVKLLTTLLQPDAGSARVCGYDVGADPDAVRQRIGLAGQSATVDELLSGRANLELTLRLYHRSRREARARAQELLEQFRLEDAADRLARTYSGGMRRRLDLAAALAAHPEVLFLDEPTTGLDPRSRNELWDLLRGLVDDGTTLVLTTQYLEEADRLADHVVVIDEGAVVAEGSPAALKARLGGARIELSVPEGSLLRPAFDVLERLAAELPSVDAEQLCVSAALVDGVGLGEAARALDAAGVPTDDIALRRPTLDDVFLTLTDRKAA